MPENWKKSVEHEDQGNIHCSWCPWNGHQEPREVIEGTGNQWQNRNHPDYGIAEIGWNNEKSSEDLWWLAFIKTPVIAHQLILVWKTLRSEKITIILMIVIGALEMIHKD